MGEAVKPVPAAEARTMIGTNAVIVGKVAEVYKTEKVTRLNFEEKYPKQTFTAVVFARNYNVFTNLDALTGKTVEISGKVQEYRGKPEVILNSRGQMRVLATESAGKAEK
jgi:DNA/RNA endonuclease YhcR with UshA esterase domain